MAAIIDSGRAGNAVSMPSIRASIPSGAPLTCQRRLYCSDGVAGLRAVRAAALRHVGAAAALGAANGLHSLGHKFTGREAFRQVFGDADNDGGLALGDRDEHGDA